MSIKALDKLGLAIVNAGYKWTPEMRKAYEDGIKESQWVGLTDEEISNFEKKYAFGSDEFDDCFGYWAVYRAIEAKLKEKNGW